MSSPARLPGCTEGTGMLTEKEKYISLMLEARYGDAATGAFRGGIEVLGHTHDDRMHQSAHSLREVLSMILILERKSGGKKAPAKEDRDGGQGYGRSLALAASGGLEQSPDDALFKGMSDIREDLSSIAHHSCQTSYHEYKELVGKYKDLLESFLKLHFDALGDVKRMMNIPDPTRDDFEKLRTLLSKNPSTYDYFFLNAGPNWLGRLAAERYIPPLPAPGTQPASLASACRAQSGYLARHAATNPDLAASLLASILGLDLGTHYPPVQLFAVRAALAMPPACALHIAKQLRPSRGRRPFSHSIAAAEAADLVVRLAKSGHVDDAVSLARALLSVRHRAVFTAGLLEADIVNVGGVVEPDITDYFFSRALETVAPPLFRAAPISAAKFLAGLLARAIRLENLTRRESERDDDLSMHWRPAMEAHPQNPSHDFKSDLVGMLAALLVETGKRSIPDLKNALQHLAEKRYPVFRRIEMHVYRHFPGDFKGQVGAAIGACFGQMRLHREYFHLLNSCFLALPEPVRKKYLDRVLGGPGNAYMERARELERAGSGPPAEQAARRWKARHLAPVKEHLGKGERDIVGDFALEEGPSHPDFVAYRETVRVGIGDARLEKGMPPDEVIAALRSYRAEEGSIYGGAGGTPYAFQDCCEAKPREYSARAADLVRLHPHLREASIRAMRTASDKGADLHWDGVLDVCEAAVEPGGGGRTVQGGGAQAVDDVASLLRSALANDRVDGPRGERVWKLLAAMAAVAPDEDELEWGTEAARQGSSGGRAAPLGSPGATVFLAAGEYALWRSRHSAGKPVLGPEVRRLFESYLDNAALHTPSKHAAIGHMLPLLYHYDREWIRSRLPRLFGGRAGALAHAAWAGYLDHNPDRASFGDMIRMYRAAVASPRRPPPEAGRDFMTYGEQLVNHVTQGHFLGMGDAEGVFDAMVAKSSKSTRSHCAWIIYLILKAHKESPLESFDPGLLRRIWEGNRLGRHEFLAVWVEFSPLGPEETLRLLHGTLESGGASSGAAAPMLLVRKLQKFAGAHPDMVLACLEDMARDESLHGEIRFSMDELPGMLEEIIGGCSERERAVALVHRLGEMGCDECGKALGGGA